MIRVAKFEKVSLTEYTKALKNANSNLQEQEIKEMYEAIKLPQRATKGSAGYDFFLNEDLILKPNETVKIATGIRIKIEAGYVLEVYPRSSLGFKYSLRLNNTVGIIDEDYYYSDNEGHIFIKLCNESKEDKVLSLVKGDAFVQGIIKQYFICVDDDCQTIRNGGLGSTSKGV